MPPRQPGTEPSEHRYRPEYWVWRIQSNPQRNRTPLDAYDSGDGISNWAAAIAINPFNSNQLMYGTGEGIWATNNLQ